MKTGRPWRGEDVCGWFACEKLDSCRGYWDATCDALGLLHKCELSDSDIEKVIKAFKSA